jgi:hypothetical protein
MAIATATSLDVYVGGKLLFEDVGFKLEPRCCGFWPASGRRTAAR